MNQVVPRGFDLGVRETKVSVESDGSVTITARPVGTPRRGRRDSFDENLALNDSLDRAGVSAELLDGVEMDIKSRAQLVENYEGGIDLLGLEVKEDKQEKTSKIGHPLLLEAVVRAQSATSGELMPAGGPCKVEALGGDTDQMDQLAAALESDMNAYLTSTAAEYYPDLDRGLFSLFYSGNLFRKVYFHPLRRRPVAETIGIEDFIVSEDATDLETAIRITHRSEMSNQQVQRMQRFADWRDCDLGYAQPTTDAAKLAQARIAGLSPQMVRQQDVPHEILEITADLDLDDYGYSDPFGTDDLPLSYVVTLDKQSGEVLAVRRGWRNGDPTFKRRQRFVHYGMIPSFNFSCLGFMHLLGNQTKALRGIWRVLVTSGLYANSPGGMKAKGVKTGSEDIRPGPGEWMDVDIGSFDAINKALMPMPYKDVSTAFMQLGEAISGDAMRMAGMAEQENGEGRTNIPVGTMMSLIEVSTQTMTAIHRRLHRAQARELQLIKDCFSEHPEALRMLVPNVSQAFTKADEFNNFNLLPASDPNIPSRVHRIQLATAMVTVAGQNPDLYDRSAIHKRAWRTIGVADADAFVLPQPAQPPGGAPGPDPLIGQARMMEAQAKIAQVQQMQTDMQRKAAESELEAQHRTQELQQKATESQMEMAARMRIAEMQTEIEQLRLQIEQARLQSEHERDLHKTRVDAATKVHGAETQALTAHHAATTTAQTAHQQGQMNTALGFHQAQLGAAGQHHKTETDAQVTREQGALQAATAHHQAGMQADTARHQAGLQSDTQRHIAGLNTESAQRIAKMKPKPGGAKT